MSACSTPGFIELSHFGEGHSRNGGDNQLRDPVAAADRERGFAEVDEDHLDLAPVTRVNGAGRREKSP